MEAQSTYHTLIRPMRIMTALLLILSMSLSSLGRSEKEVMPQTQLNPQESAILVLPVPEGDPGIMVFNPEYFSLYPMAVEKLGGIQETSEEIIEKPKAKRRGVTILLPDEFVLYQDKIS